MTEKEMRKLSRADLLTLLLEERKENERLHRELKELRGKLAARMVEIEEAGSIAEACLRLSGIFEAAQSAAAQYVENVQALCRRQEEGCLRMETETKAACEQMERAAAERCRRIEQAAKEHYNAMMARAAEDSVARLLETARDQCAAEAKEG